MKKNNLLSLPETVWSEALDIFMRTPDSLADHLSAIERERGLQVVCNMLQRLEVAAGLRRPRVALFDYTFHLIGGGQKYGLTIASAIQHDCDLTLIGNKPFSLDQLSTWYKLDLSACHCKVIDLPYFRSGNFPEIDAKVIDRTTGNPFDVISIESGKYDIFINNSMLEKVFPLANESVMVCHFPERTRGDYFYADQYNHIIYNSLYTADWIRRNWRTEPTQHIYPPVAMTTTNQVQKKEKLILSVARFERCGAKKQLEMLRAFAMLHILQPDKIAGWRLVFVGGTIDTNPYLQHLQQLIEHMPDLPVSLEININIDSLKELYARASIFWHICGLNEFNPANVEHFGMAIVEAMQNSAVPIVFDGGGQREIVIDGESGYRIQSIENLMRRTIELASQPEQLQKLGEQAKIRAERFSDSVFTAEVRRFFGALLQAYATIPARQEVS